MNDVQSLLFCWAVESELNICVLMIDYGIKGLEV